MKREVGGPTARGAAACGCCMCSDTSVRALLTPRTLSEPKELVDVALLRLRTELASGSSHWSRV